MRGWLHKPWLHFAVIGTALFAGERWLLGTAEGAATVPVFISEQQVEDLRRDWLARVGRVPSDTELEGLIEMAVDDELLLAEARALGLHRTDPLVRRRLVQNMRFVDPDSPRSDDELFDEAFDLGMDGSDIVVRRRLIQLMQLHAQGVARAVPPTLEEMEAYLAAHTERFTQPERVRIAHVYLSRDRRQEALADDAAALQARLVAESVPPDEAYALGDPFLFPYALPLRSERELSKTFGPTFAGAVMALPDGSWQGPIESAYGLHSIFVHERTAAYLSELSTVEREVSESILEERGREQLSRWILKLRERYRVVRPDDAPAARS